MPYQAKHLTRRVAALLSVAGLFLAATSAAAPNNGTDEQRGDESRCHVASDVSAQDAQPHCPSSAPAAQGARVIDAGEGYARLEIDQEAYKAYFLSSRTDDGAPTPGDPNTAVALSAVLASNEVVAVGSLIGLQNLSLPDWLNSQVLQNHGYGDSSGTVDWSDVPSADLYDAMPTLILSIAAIEEADLQDATQGFCSRRTRLRSSTRSRTVNVSQQNTLPQSGASFSASLTSQVNATGGMTAEVHYTELYRDCPLGIDIVYGLSFESGTFDVDLSLGGNGSETSEVVLVGSASAALETEVLEHTVDLWSKELGWWAWVVQFQLELDLKLDLGVRLSLDVAADFESRFVVDGDVGLTWECDGSSCAKTRDTTDVEVLAPSDPLYNVSVAATVAPYADLNFGAQLSLYGGLFDVAEAQVGVVAAVPLSFYGYFGNTCSDADGDGVMEVVQTRVVDVNAQLYGYLRYDLLGGEIADVIPIELSFFGQPVNLGIAPYTVGGFVPPVRQRAIRYADLIAGGSTGMQPILGLGQEVQPTTSVFLGTRSCYPFYEAPVYEVEWGDGTLNYTGAGGDVSHNFETTGPVQVRARIVSDSLGRDIDSPWLNVATTVSPNAGTPSRPLNPHVAANQSLEAGSAVRLSWENVTGDPQSIGYPESYKFYRSSSPATTNASFIAELFGLREFADIHVGDTAGSRFFHVAACNASGCSGLASAPQAVEVYVPAQVPSAPRNVGVASVQPIYPNQSIEIHWQNDESVPGAVGYPESFRLYRGSTPSASGASLVVELAGWRTSGNVGVGSTPGNRYFFVAACNASGCSPMVSAPSAVTVVPPPSPPNAPAITGIPPIIRGGSVFSFGHTRSDDATYYRAAFTPVGASLPSSGWSLDRDNDPANELFEVRAPGTDCELFAQHRLWLQACNDDGCSPATNRIISVVRGDDTDCPPDP